MKYFLFILILLLVLFVCYCLPDKLRKELEKEKELLKQDQFVRNTKLIIKKRRVKLKNFFTQTIIFLIAFSPFYDLQGWPQKAWDQIKNLSFTFAVLFFRSTDQLQVALDNIDKWFSNLFYGKVEEKIKQIDLVIESRKSKIQEIEFRLARLQA